MENIREFQEFKNYDKPKLLVFQGSPRKLKSCSNQTSKSKKLISYMLEYWSEIYNIEVIDLSVGDVTISPCKGCVSTSGGFHCHWKCTCYGKDLEKKDLMYEAEIYDKLEECDAFLVVSPINWYSVSTQVKAMFDRLVCANLTLTKDEAIEIMGEGNIKNSSITGPTELSGEYDHLLKNHLEGKTAAFYIHGDDGANDYSSDPVEIGDSNWYPVNSIMPLVYQCRYSGINCPDELVEAFYINKGLPYYEANLEMEYEGEFFKRMDGLLNRLKFELSSKKGKISY
jgi:multimeric flavodoxin WrbA